MGQHPMTDNEKATAFIELYKCQWQRYDKRRDFEWKVTLGLWTGIAAVTAFLAGKIQFSEIHARAYIAIWIVYVFMWTRGSWWKNEEDREFALVYLNRAEQLLKHTKEDREAKKPVWWKFLINWSRFSQISVTAVLMLLSWYVLNKIPVKLQ